MCVSGEGKTQKSRSENDIAMNKYTIEEVAQHNHVEDLWIIIHGNVYNVTSFLSEHPGGEEVLLELAGQDATECFENIGHSEEAKQLREKFKIGEVTNQGSTTQPQITSKVQSEKTRVHDMITESTINQDDRQTGGNITVIYIVIAIFAIMFYYYYKL